MPAWQTGDARPLRGSRALARGLLGLFLASSAIVVGAGTAAGHTPHDDIFDVAVSPAYDTDHTVFAISRGILLKSTDGGQTWKRLVRGIDNKLDLTALEMSPRTRRILYVSSPRDGIYRSTDAGASWAKVDRGLPTGQIAALAMSPHSDNVLYATGAKGGLFRTVDGGENWVAVAGFDVPVTAIAFAPDVRDAVLVGDEAGTLHVTRDGGASWERERSAGAGRIQAIGASPTYSVDETVFLGTDARGLLVTKDGGATFTALDKELSATSISSIVFSPTFASDTTLWVSAADDGVFVSSDGGETWSHHSSGLTTNPQVAETGYQDRVSFGRLHLAAGAHREGDRTFFLEGYNGLFRSTDDGRHWHELETLSSSIVVGLAVSPNYARDGTLAVTTYINGAFLSDDRGATWRAVNHGLEQSTMYSDAPDRIGRLFFVAFSPSYAIDHVMFSASPKRILLSTNSGNRWREIRPAGSTLSEAKPRQYMVAVSPDYRSDQTVVLGDSSGEVFRSTDGGSSFARIGTVPQPIRSFTPSPMFGSDSTVFAGTGHGVFESMDRGVTWAPIGPDRHNVAVVAVSPGYGSDQTIFAGAGDGLFVTRDAGARWENVGVAAFGPAASVQAVAVSPDFTRDGIVLASIQGRGLVRSTDGGTTFAPVGNELNEDNQLLNNFSKPTSVPIVFSPNFASDRTVFGFSGTEVFKSTDAGDTWTNVELPRTLHDADTSGGMGTVRAGISAKVILAALVAAGLSYVLLGIVRLARRRSRHFAIRLGCSLGVFVVAVSIMAR